MNSKSAVLCLAVALTGASVLAVGFIGTPTAELGKGRWGLGFNYSYSTQDLEKKDYVWSSGLVDKVKLSNFRVQRYYGTLSYGVTDWWDVYAQLGFSDLKTDGKETWSSGRYEWDMNFDKDFAGGWGTKVTFARQEKIDWGATFQMNWLDTYWSNRYSWGMDEADINMYDLLFAAGPAVDMGGWKIYGGPYYYYLNGGFDETVKDPNPRAVTSNLRNDGFGGFIGTQFNLTSNCAANIEYSSSLSNIWSLGTGITFKF